MAPLRSSRSTRHADHANASRARAGVLDLDPTDGLPVQKWSQASVRVNQDASLDAANLNSKSTNSADWNAQFGTAQFPWQEPELPTFYKELPTWNQEMIRRARTGNTTAKLSVWDRKNACWMSAAEAEKRSTPLKSLHLNNLDDPDDKGANGDADSSKSDQDDDDEDDNKSEDEEMPDDEAAAPFKTTAISSKRRKLAGSLLEPREFEVKRWMQLPASVAEKAVDPKFLADRRPGMPPLYVGEYAASIFGQFASTNFAALGTNYDLGDGGGLGNAVGVLGAGEAPAAPTPPRRNIPPKRKKKKLGGPGRRKANPNPAPVTEAAQGGPVQPTEGAVAAHAVAEGEDSKIEEGTPADGATPMDKTRPEGGDGSDESEAEGSEEGEIDEGSHTERKEEAPESKDDPVTAATETQGESQAPVVVSEVVAVDTLKQDTDTSMVEPAVAAIEAEPIEEKVPEKTTAEEEVQKIAEQEAVPEAQPPTEISPKAATTEPDLLGGLDAAIDKDITEEKAT